VDSAVLRGDSMVFCRASSSSDVTAAAAAAAGVTSLSHGDATPTMSIATTGVPPLCLLIVSGLFWSAEKRKGKGKSKGDSLFTYAQIPSVRFVVDLTTNGKLIQRIHIWPCQGGLDLMGQTFLQQIHEESTTNRNSGVRALLFPVCSDRLERATFR